ncbi:MAG: hypothetical protein K8R21_00670 [Leptospira sp.]|nr:hypothetical protein [Leptospira sp.]
MVFVRRIHIFKLPLFVFFLLALPLVADDDWSDLHKDEKKIYGSEKEIKYDVNAFFWERENWDQHYSNEVLWLYKHTDYPKFRSTYVFPFYNGLESKFDNRKKYRFLNFYYKQDKSFEQAVFFPFVFQGGDKAIGESYLGIFPAFYSRTYEGNGFSGSTFLTPFFYRSTDKTKTEKISEEEAFSISPFHLNIYEKK